MKMKLRMRMKVRMKKVHVACTIAMRGGGSDRR
jgi:hypothetical protein